MLSVDFRPASDDERAWMVAQTLSSPEGCVDGFIHWFISLIGGGVLGMLAATALVAGPFYIFHLPNTFALAFSASGLVLGLMSGARSLWRERDDTQKHIYLARQDADDGRVQVWHCSVRDALKVEVGEAECWFLEVGERKVLFLGGDYLDEDALPENEDDFEMLPPCRTLNLIKTPLSGQLIKIDCLDGPLTEWKTRADFVLDRYFPNDGEILDASLDTLHKDLRRSNAKNPAVIQNDDRRKRDANAGKTDTKRENDRADG